MYVFVTVTLLMSISKTRIHWIFVVTTNSLLHQKIFTVPSFLAMTILTIYLGISSTAFYEFHVISIRKIKKQVLLSNLVIEQCFHFRIWTLFISNVPAAVIFRMQNSKVVIWIPNILLIWNLNSYYSIQLRLLDCDSMATINRKS